MTLGQKLKKLRNEKGITQKELADQLYVSFQTVSKWENDENEPDFTTLKELTKILGCTADYLFSDEEEIQKEGNDNNHNEKSAGEKSEVKMRFSVGICRDCDKILYDGDRIHNIERKSESGVKEVVTICDDCFNAHEKKINKRAREVEESLNSINTQDSSKKGLFGKIAARNDNKPLIAGIIVGVIALIITLIVCLAKFDVVGIGWTIGGPILAGYTVLSTIYCIFTESYISDVFSGVASWSFRFPGLIFTWSVQGIIWLIAMKLLFAVLGLFISIGVFMLAIALSAALSDISFIPLLIYNKKHY